MNHCKPRRIIWAAMRYLIKENRMQKKGQLLKQPWISPSTWNILLWLKEHTAQVFARMSKEGWETRCLAHNLELRRMIQFGIKIMTIYCSRQIQGDRSPASQRNFLVRTKAQRLRYKPLGSSSSSMVEEGTCTQLAKWHFSRKYCLRSF